MTPAEARAVPTGGIETRLAYVAACPPHHLPVLLGHATARRAQTGDDEGHETALIARIYDEMDKRREQGR